MIEEKTMIEFGSSSKAYFELHEAAEKGDLAKIKQLVLNNKLWINMPNEKGNSAFYLAAKKGHLNVVGFLIVDQDARAYRNSYEKTPIDCAVGDVKIYLQNRTMKIFDINTLIDAQIYQIGYDQHEKMMDFLFTLPKKYQRDPLQRYTKHLTFKEPQKLLDLMDRIPNKETGIKMLSEAVLCALSCGDFDLANELAERIPESSRGRELAFQTIIEFTLRIEKFEKKTPPHQFGSIILKSFKSNTSKKIFEERIIKEMILRASFRDAFEYAKNLENPQEREFARSLLANCKLEEKTSIFFEKKGSIFLKKEKTLISLEQGALISKKIAKEQMEEWYRAEFVKESCEINQYTNFEQRMDRIEKIKKLWLKYQVIASVADALCKKGDYNEAYTFHEMLREWNVVFVGLNDAIQNIIKHLKEKKETQLIELFSRLLR